MFITEAEQEGEMLKNILVDKYCDKVLQGFSDGMKGLKNPNPTYGLDDEECEFDVETEETENKKFMIQKIKYEFNNLGVVEMNTQADKSPYLVKGGNLVITHNLEMLVVFSIASDRMDGGSESEWETVSY